MPANFNQDEKESIKEQIEEQQRLQQEHELRIEREKLDEKKEEKKVRGRKLRRLARLSRSIVRSIWIIITNPITWIILIGTAVSIYMFAALQIFGKNDYNIECDPSGVGVVNVDSDVDDFTRQVAIVDWLMSTDFPKLGGPMTKEQAAGVVGNMIAESAGGKPNYVQTLSMRDPDYYKQCDNKCVLDWGEMNGRAIGFLQWDGGRRKNMVKYAEKEGKPWYDLNIQLHWLKKELEGYDGEQLVAGGFHEPGKSPSEYAVIWNRRFERSSMADDSPNVKKRSKDAEDFASKYKGGGGGGSFGTSCVDMSDFNNVNMGPVPKEISYYQGIEMSMPADKSLLVLTERWGLYSPFGEEMDHKGVDLAPRDGKEGHALYSMIDGVVAGVGYQGNGWGNWVLIQSKEVPSFSIRFAHLQTPPVVNKGDTVKRGQFVGPMGNTGMSRGAHVHVEFLSNGVRFNPELAFKFE